MRVGFAGKPGVECAAWREEIERPEIEGINDGEETAEHITDRAVEFLLAGVFDAGIHV